MGGARSPPSRGRRVLFFYYPTPSPGGIEELADIHRETVVLRAGKYARDNLLTGQRAIAQRQYGGGALIELHNTRGPGQKMAVSRGVLLQLTSRSEPNPARPGQCFVLHAWLSPTTGPFPEGKARRKRQDCARVFRSYRSCKVWARGLLSQTFIGNCQLPCARGIEWRFIRRYNVLRLMPSWAATRVMFP
jgi:hypothetical protein